MAVALAKPIDFLPDSYRQATKRRRTSHWRLVVTALFIGTFVATAWGVHRYERDVEEYARQVRARASTAQTQAAVIHAKRAELAALEQYAALLTFLRHPWPRSRVIDAVVGPLPDSVTLVNLRITTADKPAVAASETPVGENAAEAKPRDAGTDLDELRKQAESVDVVVRLEGIARDLPAFHAYLQKLSDGELFVDAQLTSIEAMGDRGASAVPSADGARTDARASRFVAQVVVRPGWGLTGGPELDPQDAAATSPTTVPALRLFSRSGTP